MIYKSHQIEELLKLVEFYFTNFIGQNISVHYLTDYEKSLLESFGVNLDDLNPNSIDDAFKYGMLSTILDHATLNGYNYDQVLRAIRSKSFLPLTFREQAALNAVKFQAYSHIKGLGNKVVTDFSNVLIESDMKQRRAYEKIIQEAAAQTVENREGVKYMTSLIGHKTKDWARDLDRISDFILHNVHDQGRAAQIAKLHGDNATVYKHVHSGACKHCVRLYLTNGEGSAPRMFTLDELTANGTNIGRKVEDWLAVIGATHPWCRCTLEKWVDGAVWDVKIGGFGKIELTEKEKKVAKLLKFKIEAA